jgi:hypothetical protein
MPHLARAALVMTLLILAAAVLAIAAFLDGAYDDVFHAGI